MPGRVRIIGGQWRGRKIEIADMPELRPTPDRVRETLFNWLRPVIDGAQCLDLFAGTGVLGFEALSRGAGSVVMVESSRALCDKLKEQAKRLGAENLEIVHADALQWLQKSSRSFDITFLDPPFAQGLVEKVCRHLLDYGILEKGGWIYAESERGLDIQIQGLEKIKEGKAGRVQYQLLKYQ